MKHFYCENCKTTIYGKDDAGDEMICPNCGNKAVFSGRKLDFDPNGKIEVENPDEADKIIEKLEEKNPNLLDDLLDEFGKESDQAYFNKEAAKAIPLKAANIGDSVVFGKLIWKVIKIEQDKKLLIVKDIINISEYTEVDEDKIDYNRPYEEVTLFGKTEIAQSEYRWAPSKIRTFLNNEFLKENLSDDEMSMIVPSTIEYKKADGKVIKVEDKVFILSKDEIVKYIPNKENRISGLHNIFADNYILRDYILRLDDESGYQPYIVDNSGEVELLEKGYVSDNCRPVIFVKI